MDVRPITDAEVADWLEAVRRGFLYAHPDPAADLEKRRPGIDVHRTLAGFDGAAMVATLRSFATSLTLPGGSTVPTDAVTAVTTTSTHRRRGLATALVTRDLRDSAERGEPVAVLIAAEWGIYGRFGYGAATEHQTLTLHTRSARQRRKPSGSVEFVDRDTARALAPGIYDRHRAQQAGELEWDERAWDIDYGLVPSFGGDDKPGFHVIARDASGEPVGFARYRHDAKWDRRQAAGQVQLGALIGSTVEGQALLWQHLIELDLVTTVVAGDRSPGDLLPWLLEDPRDAAASDRADFVWVRVIDAPPLLSARTYAATGELVIEVVDLLGLAQGRYLLDAGADGASCTRTDRSPDLTMPVATLGSILLGGHRVRTMADVGLLDEHVAGAAARADLMFSTPTAPWSSSWF